MTQEQITIFVIIGITLVLFITEKWRYDIVALFALFLSVVTGIVPAKEAFTGFSDPVVITVACILIISAAISRSGFINWVLKALSVTNNRPYLQVFALSAMVIILSAWMNNVGALAVFLPITLMLARKSDRPPSEMLMPLSFGSLLGGLVTLIGTPPNLLISNIRQEMLGKPYEMFDFAPVGMGICVAGLLYLTFAWRILPKDRRGNASAEDKFEIKDYVSEIQVAEDSLIIGRTISEIEDETEGDLQVIAVIKNDRDRVFPSARRIVRASDHLIIRCDPIVLKGFVDKAKVNLAGGSKPEEAGVDGVEKENLLTADDLSVVEAVVMRDSDLRGQTARRLSLRSRFGLNLLAISGSASRASDRLRDTVFHEGDVVVFQGATDTIPETLKELGCLPLAERNLQLGRASVLFLPVLILIIAVGLTVAGVLPISIAFLGGVIAVAIMKIMRLNEMYEAIDWPVIILLGAMMPVASALQTTGGTDLIAGLVANVSQGLSGPYLIGIIIIASMIVTPFLNNAAAVLLMAPIAGGMAMKLGLNVDPFLMAVAVGTSCDFLTPIGHQSNTLVMGPGGYKFNDYWKLGLPLSILVVALGVPLILWAWPLK